MDIQRSLLIGATLVLAFMLMTEWGKFQQQHATPVAAITAPAVPGMPSTSTPAADVPAAIGEAATAPEAKAETARLIRVRTDVLDIQIDRLGGDIVYAALPKYSAKLESPDQPFVLLEQNERRQYVAKSGLVGLDSNSGRPLYQSTGDNFQLSGDSDNLTVTLSCRNRTASCC